MQQINNPYSDLKILCHPDKLKAILNQERTAPLYVRIKPTNVCNQNCSYCVYANDAVIDNRNVDRKVSISWEKMQEILKDLHEIGTKAITFSGGGEPLCYPRICDTLGLVQDYGFDFAMITNGQALNQRERSVLREANWVRISLDSINKEMYTKIRGVDTFSHVIDNIGHFAKEKKDKCVLGINFVVTKENYLHIYDFCKMMSAIGVNHVKISPLMVKGTIPEYHASIRGQVGEQIQKVKEELQNSQFALIDKYTDDDSFNKNFKKKYSRCCIKEIFTVIGADCKVYYCHQRAYTEKGCIGSIESQSFRELWFSDETSKRFRNMDAGKECNFRCVFEERNQFLNILVNMDKQHINFI